MKETDNRGEWEVTQGKLCKSRLLVKPSQSFLDWQASNPVTKPEPARNLFTEFDSLKATLKGKGIL